MEISTVHCLKKFVNERLLAAAEEIFGVFEKTLSAYEKEIIHQRDVLNIVLKPEIKLKRTDLPPSACKDGALDTEGTTSLAHTDTTCPLIKEEMDERCTSPAEEQFAIEEDAEADKLSSASSETELSEDETLPLRCAQTSSAAEEETQFSFPAEWSEYEENQHGVTEPQPEEHVEIGEKPYLCSICGERFKIVTELRLHGNICTKQNRCKFCGKELASRASLMRHQLVHTGERPHECHLCGKRFRARQTLKVHYRIHTGEKPYKCGTCDKAFTTCSNLKKHMSVHAKVGNG